ncbi:MAG: insulinase family protein, partial [Deltaproteobacteria bacterium]|nr:insulinase family protein [Deltaproteobacteria bacterium]
MKTSAMCWLILLVLALYIVPMDTEAQDYELKRLMLANGLEVIIRQEPDRKVAALQYWVRVGSADEDDSQRGISHLIEHMAFKGTQ